MDAYLRYAIAFDALAYPASSEASCHRARRPACLRLRREVLGRLIEERLVLAYARRHHITLDKADETTIGTELTTMGRLGSPTAGLLRHVPRRFVRSVLARELLVQKVEEAIAGPEAEAGPAVHLKRYTVPVRPGTNRQELYQQALAVAGGGSMPAGAVSRDDWVATFRLPAWLARALHGVRPGEYVGPFERSRSFLLVQLVARGHHAYGAPARNILIARSFHLWLRQTLSQTRIRCLGPSGRMGRCAPSIMKTA